MKETNARYIVFCIDSRPEISISMVETLGFKGDKKKVEDMQLFEPYKPIKNPVKKKQ